MRTLGIDFGERRIGLALSDPDGRLATPWGAIERRSDRAAIRRIAQLAGEEDVGALVLGLPRTLSGDETAAALRVRRFGEALQTALGLPLSYIDEALSSRQAEERLREAGQDPRKHPDRVDAVAAQIILEDALQHPGGGPS